MNAGAVFDGFVVLGNEAGVKAAIDASKGGSTLSGRRRLQEARSTRGGRPARPLLPQHAGAR